MRKTSQKPTPAPKISDAEWLVMRVVWEKEPVTANDVVSSLAEANEVNWKPKTVHTLLRRLLDKQALTYTKQGREFIYRANVSATECEHAESKSFLQRVYGGNVAPFLASFVENEAFSAEEVEELKRILERHEAKTDEKKSPKPITQPQR